MKPGKPNGKFSHRLEVEQRKRERCEYDGDPPACRNCKRVAMPVPGGQYPFPRCRQHGFSVRMHAICDSWVGVDGVKLEGAS